MGWENINLSTYSTSFLHTQVLFENEANASAIAEKWFGLCKNIENFICLNIKSGLGAGIFINGKLFTGNNGYSGEIGHTVFYENNIKCKCGNSGCLETFVTLPYIVEKAKNILRKKKVKTELNNFVNIEEIDSNKIIEEAKKGDLFCKNLIIESAKYTGIAIAGLINSFNPSKVILGEDFIKYSEIAFDQVKIIASKNSLKYLNSKVEIEVSQIGEKSSTIGAAVIPMRVLFNN
jgi:predicted NBD/HSP70 family sugar kinase